MRTAVDTNVISEMLHGKAESRKAALLMTEAQQQGALIICPVVYAELLASPYLRSEQVDSFLHSQRIILQLDMDFEVWQQAGLRFGGYAARRKRSGGGGQQRLLADFIIGAHALFHAERLLTFDQRRYQIDFPDLTLVG